MKIDSSVAAVVTGGASGLGEASARALAARGAKVALFDLNEERGRQVAEEIGGIACRVDVADEASVDAGFARAREAHGKKIRNNNFGFMQLVLSMNKYFC